MVVANAIATTRTQIREAAAGSPTGVTIMVVADNPPGIATMVAATTNSHAHISLQLSCHNFHTNKDIKYCYLHGLDKRQNGMECKNQFGSANAAQTVPAPMQ